MTEWSLALRNLLRNRRRSLSTVLALAIGLTAVLLFSGFKANLRHAMLSEYVRAGGHLQVQHRDYFIYGSGNPAAYGIVGHLRLLQAIRGDAELARLTMVVTPMLRFGGMAGNFDAGISRTVIGTGYVADDMGRMRRWNEFAVPGAHGAFPLQGSPDDAALVGVGLARVLQLCAPLGLADCAGPGPQTIPEAATADDAALPADIASLADAEHPAANKPAGARIELLSSSARGAPNVAAVRVVAAEDQGFKELDDVAVIVHLAQAQRLVWGRGEPRVTAIMLTLHRTADEARAADRLKKVLAGTGANQLLVVRTFSELNPFYVQSVQLFDVIFGFIFALIGGIVLFTVGNTMNTAVVERTVEIGTLRAIGLRQSGVRRLFVTEGLLLGCVGTAAGIAAAIAAGAAINWGGWTWLPPGSSKQLPLEVRVLADATIVSGCALGMVVIAVLAAWWPAWRAANLNVVEALRHA